ncbi:MAG: sialate O-acetylesterase [Cryomorphaceae bacterium]|jgi:sialate O-acetylesterase
MSLITTKSRFRFALRVTFCVLVLGLAYSGLLPAAELSTAFPKEKPPLELVPRLGRPFGDNAVFQQKIPVPVWGWTLPGTDVEVSFDSQKHVTKAGADGRFEVKLDAMPADKLKSVNDAPAGRTLTVITRAGGKQEKKECSNILIGEVWLCSGQSNMSVRFSHRQGTKESQVKADFPALRFLENEWTVSTPKTVGRCYSISFVFGRKLQSELLVPIGLMNAAVAGTGIEGWQYIAPGEIPIKTKYQNFIPKIEPLVGHAMRGALWYQGEANVKNGKDYLPKLKRLIKGWRGVWNQGDYPFYFVQLAAQGKSPTDQPAGGDGRAAIRNAQFEALAILNTGMAVAIDIGEKKEHPFNKYDVGLRLAYWALHNDYGKKAVVPSGPLYKEHKIEGSTIRVKFDYAENGLMLANKDRFEPPVATPDAAIPWLSIQAKDGKWHWAEGKIDGSDLIVYSKKVTEPIAVRYAYTQFPTGCNLYNKDGLPASPFSTSGY